MGQSSGLPVCYTTDIERQKSIFRVMCLGVIESYSVSYTYSWRIKKVFDNVEKSPPFVKMARSISFYGRQKDPSAYSWSAALF